MRILARALIISLALSATASLVRAAPRPREAGEPIPVPKELEKQLRAVVPKGWTVTVKGDALTVRRNQPIKVFYHLPNEPPRPKDFDYKKHQKKLAVAETFAVTFHFRRRVSREQYRKWEAENANRQEKLETLRKKIRQAKVVHKFDDYLPETREQKRLVADYRQAQTQLPYRRLPDGYTPVCSIDVKISPTHGFGYTLINKEQDNDCAKVQKQVLGLFRTYPVRNHSGGD